MAATPPLVSTDWLAEHLEDDSVRVLDATVVLTLNPEGGDVTIESGREEWAKGHIPGAGFADLIAISDPEIPLRFMLPTPESFAEDMSELGVGSGTHVVVYDWKSNEWAARLWWMLRVFGHDDVSVLDGGLTAWKAAGLPVSTGDVELPRADFAASYRPEMVATREEVQEHIASGGVCMINALRPELHTGEVPIAHGRAGRLPGSVNVPTGDLRDPDTNRFLPPEQLRERFDAAEALGDEKVVTYCGGGIDAALDALALALIGRDDVAVYDGSLVEWAENPEAPLETG